MAWALLLVLGIPGITHASSAQDETCKAGFAELLPMKPVCGFALSESGLLAHDGRQVAKPLVVSHEQRADGHASIGAKRVVLFPPSPDGRFRLLQACDGKGSGALCWALFAFDKDADTVQQAFGGKYGPMRWQSWNADGSYVVVSSKSGQASWLHIIDAATGNTRSVPSDAAGQNWAVQPDTLVWLGARRFSIVAASCASCAAQRRTIEF